jgi:alcohol dehydrogenase (cytochrome c)
MLIDLPVNGETRKALVTSGKLGISRRSTAPTANGSGTRTMVAQKLVTAIDPKTGAKTINTAASIPRKPGVTTCPSHPGARGWPATAIAHGPAISICR